MADFADIFIATTKTAENYNLTSPQFTYLSLAELSDHEISELWITIDRGKLDFDHYALEFIEIESDELLYKLPTVLTKKLAALDAAQIKTAAALWVEAEDVPYKPAEAQEVIANLADLARQAIESKQDLFFMMA